MTRDDIIAALAHTTQGEIAALYQRANAVKIATTGKKVYLRGLIEFSNICRKNCYYCGIRRTNKKVKRYILTDKEVMDAVDFAWRNRYGSIVLQSGEQQSAKFTAQVTRLIHKIKTHTHGEIGITLSCGEQSVDTYKQWFAAGAHRYLLRIETSNRKLYRQLHPSDPVHDFDTRLTALRYLKETGYQTGTGVMIGLPFQTLEDLSDDLLFFRQADVSMVGMGPYLEHSETPLYAIRNTLLPPEKRLELSLKMIACLRLLMNDINIAATTALQALDPEGREQAIGVGANVLMPNITPLVYRKDYLLYENKPCINEEASQCLHCLNIRIKQAGAEIGYEEWGDAPHFFRG